MDRQIEEEKIREQATIYKKETIRPLSDYQRRVNEIAQDMCVKNPSMLRNRKELLEMARTRVEETYQFKKGKSRSKRHNPVVPPPKRKKTNHSMRLARMKTLEDDIKNFEERILYKEKRRQVAEDNKNYRLCDELTEEIGSLSREKRQCAAELKLFQKKDEFSKLYYRRKSANESPSVSSGASRSEVCSPPISNSDHEDVPPMSKDASCDTVVLSGNSSDQESDSNFC